MAQYCLTSAVWDSVAGVFACDATGACLAGLSTVAEVEASELGALAEEDAAWRAEADRPRANTQADITTTEKLFIKRETPDAEAVSARPVFST